jgi:hypothetical protein
VRRFGRGPATSEHVLRFYVYVSDAKVDMLIAQMPQRLIKRIAAELTIDLKLLRLTLKTVEAPETRFNRVAIVSAYLARRGHVGPVESRKRYLEAEAVPMRWGLVGRNEEESIAFFAGEQADSRIFLTGSPHHVVGAKPMAPVGYHSLPGSYNPPLNVYYDVFQDWDEPQELSGTAYGYAEQFSEEMGRGSGSLSGRPLEGLSFLARRIDVAHDRDGRRRVIGSPLWVAVSDPD